MHVQEIRRKCLAHGYVTDDKMATTLALMQRLERPLLIEGEAGVGKTAIATTLAKVMQTQLVRLQCYEGLDTNAAVYEWNYSRQLLWMKFNEEGRSSSDEENIFDRQFLLERPLLKAIQQTVAPVLLIDEIDRADEAFEAFLLELLSEFQITIPEIGTITARSKPLVILTSNGTRELSDALRRRCLYHYLGFPDASKELAIIKQRLPDLDQTLARQIVCFVQALRDIHLRKRPGIAETLDWACALMGVDIRDLHTTDFDVSTTLSCLLKTREDTDTVSKNMLDELIAAVP